MKTVVIVAMAVLASLIAMSRPVRAPEQASGRVRVIAGRPESAAVPIPGQATITNPAPPLPLPVASIPDSADSGAPHPSDATALEALFADQVREPVWATATEAAMKSWIPAGGTIGCSAFMCRIEVPVDGMPEGATLDARAVILSANWPKSITYNRYTAINGERDGASTIILFATAT